MIVSQLLADARIAHGFATRVGGVSTGRYASLNCGFGSADERAAVAENRRRVLAMLDLDGARLLTVHQVHGTDVATVTEAWEPGSAPRADAMATDRPDLALGILTADCAPVLLADPDAGVIGACHAGWKGAIAGITDETIAAMLRLGARRMAIRAVIGPCIGPASYEVGETFVEQFLASDPDNSRFFTPGARPGHRLFDLPGYVLARLERAGISDARWTGEDTLPDDARFFSYRRVTLAGGGDYGRQISVIALRR